MASEPNTQAPRHRIPVIDRMVEILDVLAGRPDGASISDLVGVVGVPRTTVYRILNTLQDHGLIRRAHSGNYSLGPKFTHLASKMSGSDPGYDLAAIATPHLERLSGALGEGAKLNVMENGQLLVLAAVQGQRPYALGVRPGQRMPLHAGAAGKVLLAFVPESAREPVIDRELVRFTARTIADRRQLLAELKRIRKRGWADDKGEFMLSILAFAAPVRAPGGGIAGAVSVPFLAGAAPEREAEIRDAVIATAAAISAAIPDVEGFGARAANGPGKRA